MAQVVDVSFEGRADRSAYRVITYQHDEIGDTIDASTGNIIGDGIVVPVSTLEVKDKTMLGGFSKTGIDLSEVVPIAEAYDLPGGSCY